MSLTLSTIVPSHFIEELKSAPMDKVDFIGIVRDLMEGDYTGIGHRSRLHPDTLKLGLTPKVSSMMPEVQDEVDVAFRDAFPACEDWTEIELLPVFANIVARASSRMMGGKPLSRDKEWIQASIDFSHCALSGSQKIKVSSPSSHLPPPGLSFGVEDTWPVIVLTQ